MALCKGRRSFPWLMLSGRSCRRNEPTQTMSATQNKICDERIDVAWRKSDIVVLLILQVC